MSPKRKIRQESKETENKDMISSVPDEVLGEILSLLPTKDAVATSLLVSFHLSGKTFTNSRIRSISMIPHSFHSSFIRFVSQVIVQCQKSEITKFRLKCANSVRHVAFTYWLNTALNLLEVPELEVFVEMRDSYPLNLPEWACQNLRVLKLGYNFILRVPKDATFSCLKILFLEGVIFQGSEIILHRNDGVYWLDGINAILGNCPLLEELSMIGCDWKGGDLIFSMIGCDWKGGDLIFSNPLLKKLTLEVGIRGMIDQLNGSSIFFKLPSLVYLKYSDGWPEVFNIRCLDSVVDAHFEVAFNDDQFEEQELCDTMLDLIKGVSKFELQVLVLIRPVP